MTTFPDFRIFWAICKHIFEWEKVGTPEQQLHILWEYQSWYVSSYIKIFCCCLNVPIVYCKQICIKKCQTWTFYTIYAIWRYFKESLWHHHVEIMLNIFIPFKLICCSMNRTIFMILRTSWYFWAKMMPYCPLSFAFFKQKCTKNFINLTCRSSGRRC